MYVESKNKCLYPLYSISLAYYNQFVSLHTYFNSLHCDSVISSLLFNLFSVLQPEWFSKQHLLSSSIYLSIYLFVGLFVCYCCSSTVVSVFTPPHPPPHPSSLPTLEPTPLALSMCHLYMFFDGLSHVLIL